MSRLIAKCDKSLPSKKYGILYADPCWHFGTYSNKGQNRSPSKHYKTLGIEAIKRLPFGKIAADDAWLFMWVYGPLADEASSVVRAWDFKVSSKEGFIWVKTTKDGEGLSMGTGYTTRKCAETMLIAKRGNPKRLSGGVRQVVHCSRHGLAHSEKPAIFRDKIVALCGDIPRIELFSRHNIEGWDAHGNQVGKLS
ncbi:MAG: DNA methyltransferase [Magnetovibrio sp.]|nr:DNA methyltransferase [Magnetovibrio sp.]